eukprot:778736-Prorocentrum_minimum.AAC.7
MNTSMFTPNLAKAKERMKGVLEKIDPLKLLTPTKASSSSKPPELEDRERATGRKMKSALEEPEEVRVEKQKLSTAEVLESLDPRFFEEVTHLDESCAHERHSFWTHVSFAVCLLKICSPHFSKRFRLFVTHIVVRISTSTAEPKKRHWSNNCCMSRILKAR